MRRIKFVNRKATNFVLVIERDFEEKDFMQLFRESRQRGDFDVDFHYLVHRDGSIEEGREEDVVGSFEISDEDAVIIFVDVLHGKETDMQKETLANLVERLQKKYKGVVVQKTFE